MELTANSAHHYGTVASSHGPIVTEYTKRNNNFYVHRKYGHYFMGVVHFLSFINLILVWYVFIHCCIKGSRKRSMATGYTTYWKRCVSVAECQVPLTVNASPAGNTARCRPFRSLVDASPTALPYPDGMSSDAVNGMNAERVAATHTLAPAFLGTTLIYRPQHIHLSQNLCLTLGSTNI